ncbi:MFS transporter [Mesocricetibacter intestinalis]|nr:MFS transporter [Mesocricetibacter intestinalis]
MNLRETIDQSPMSAYQWAVIMMATVMNLLDGFDVLALAFTATAIRAEFGLSGTQLGYLLSAGLIGMSAGSLFLAPLADRIGRRPLLLISVALSALGMLGSAFVSDAVTLGFWRLLTGLGVGGILVGTNVLASEYSSRKWRSLAISIYSSGFGIGAVLGGIFAVALQKEYSWHAVYLAGALLTGLCFIALWVWLPESIDFLLSGRVPKATEQLQRICRKMGLKGNWEFVAPAQGVLRKPSVFRLFEKEYARATMLIWTAFFAVMFSYYLISSWTPALLKDAGMSTDQSITVGIMIAMGGTCGSLLYGLLASRWAARSVLILFTLLSAAVVVAFILSSALLWLAMLLGIIVGACMNGCISGFYTLNPSIYAAEIRGTGVGWSIGVGRIGAIFAPITAGSLLDYGWDKQSLYIGVAFVLLISSVALVFLRSRSTLRAV